jgi:hypothetical protein
MPLFKISLLMIGLILLILSESGFSGFQDLQD